MSPVMQWSLGAAGLWLAVAVRTVLELRKWLRSRRLDREARDRATGAVVAAGLQQHPGPPATSEEAAEFLARVLEQAGRP